MQGSLSLLGFIVGYVAWIAYMAYRWYSTGVEAKELYPRYIEEGTLRETVSEEDFVTQYKRTQGPRFGIHLFITAHIALIIGVIFIRIFNVVWLRLWIEGGRAPFLEIGQWPHSTILVLIYIALFFVVAWFSMRYYHKNSPGTLRGAVKRLNGDQP